MSQNKPPERRSVFPGLCRRDGVFVCGVLESQDFCDPGSWAPPHVVADRDYTYRQECRSGFSQQQRNTAIGRCGPDGICSHRADRCPDPETFVALDPDCGVTHDNRPGAANDMETFYTTYGRCGDDRCVWAPSECLEGEAYTANDPSCTADRVAIGACLDGFGYCTVAAENCAFPAADEPYYDHASFVETFGTACFLAAFLPGPPTQAPTGVPTKAMADVVPPPDPLAAGTPQQEATRAPLSQNSILGIAIGMTLVLGVSVGLAASRLRSYRNIVAAAASEKEESAGAMASEAMTIPQTITIDVGSGDNNDQESAFSDPSESLSC